MLHPLSERIADQANVIALMQLERRRTASGLPDRQDSDKGSSQERSESHEKPAKGVSGRPGGQKGAARNAVLNLNEMRGPSHACTAAMSLAAQFL
jgi:hypothetical protein